jgi:hypothetical protein
MRVSQEMKPWERFGMALLLSLLSLLVFGAFIMTVYAVVQAVKCGVGG